MKEEAGSPEIIRSVGESSSAEQLPVLDGAREYISLATLEHWKTPDYKMYAEGSQFEVVILGEAHTDDEARKKQLELIEIVRPQFVLHEFLSGYVYDPVSKMFREQRNRKFDPFGVDFSILRTYAKQDLPHLIKQSERLGHTLVGCDLTSFEETEVIDQLEEHDPSLRNFQGIGLTGVSPQVMPYRDQQMMKSIQEYTAQSKKPVIAILGAGHGNNLHQKGMIKQQGIQYAYVNQSANYSYQMQASQ